MNVQQPHSKSLERWLVAQHGTRDVSVSNDGRIKKKKGGSCLKQRASFRDRPPLLGVHTQLRERGRVGYDFFEQEAGVKTESPIIQPRDVHGAKLPARLCHRRA